jgi:hypothetical protein
VRGALAIWLWNLDRRRVVVELREAVLAVMPVIMLVGLFALAAFWISRRARMREFAHRERLAMIDKGLVPPAELYPGGPALSVVDNALASDAAAKPSHVATRFRSAGVMFVGLGVALALIIGVTAGTPDVGLGIGGAIAALGAAMIVNAVLMSRESAGAPRTSREPAPPA